MNVPVSQFVDRPKRWPLVVQAANRSASFLKDARLVNAYAEKDPNTGEWQVQKRPGLHLSQTLGGGGAYGRGMYSWYSIQAYPTPAIYAVVGDGLHATLYKNWAVLGTAGGLTDSSSPWMWTEMQGSQSITGKLVFAGLTALYYTDGTAAPAAPTLPANRGSSIVGLDCLDSTCYFMDQNCQIWGSNLNDPSTWQATNLITAQKIPGAGVALVRQLSYLIALKSASMEVFYDAGNATGSPLSQVDSATNSWGCADRNTVRIIDDTLFYISANRTGSPKVVQVFNLAPSVVSSPAVERLIRKWQATGGSTYAWVLKHAGHRFYCISSDSLLGTGISLAYDLDQSMWYQWTDANGNWWPISAIAVDNSYNQVAMAASGNAGQLIYTLDSADTYPTDNNSIVPVDIYTPSTGFDTPRRKVLHRMYFDTDQTPGSHLYVRRSDDDFQSWSNFRQVDLSRSDPYIDGEGKFTRRAYHLRHAAPTDFRLRAANLQMDIGAI